MPDLPDWLKVVLAITPVVAGATAIVMRGIARLNERLKDIQIRLGVVEQQNRALMKAFPAVISSLMRAQFMSSDEGMQIIANALEPASIAEIISKIKPTVNPLSQADIDRLNNYIARLKLGQRLTVQESQDFYRLTDIITHEYPNNEGSWLLALVSGILLGAILAKK